MKADISLRLSRARYLLEDPPMRIGQISLPFINANNW